MVASSCKKKKMFSISIEMSLIRTDLINRRPYMATTSGFKKVKDFSLDEMKSLQRCAMDFETTQLRDSSQKRYFAILHLFNGSLDIRWSLTQAVYNIIRISNNERVYSSFQLKVPFRMSSGEMKGNDGISKRYYFIEAVASFKNGVRVLNHLLDSDEAELFSLLNEKNTVSVVDRGSVKENDDFFNQEDPFDPKKGNE